MNTRAKLNITSVIGVKDGIEQIFSLINECLEAYAQHTDEIARIVSCQNYVHQLNGLLEMLELSGITIVSREMEKLIEALACKRIQSKPAIIDILKQASQALSRYLNELIEGAEDNSLRLFSTYHDLMQAHGAKNVFASDLFVFNRIAEPPVMEALSHLDTAEIKALAKQIRTEYQTGLLKWLRNTANKDDLQRMAHAVSQIESFPGSIEQRSFWWVCTGFMDSLLDQGAAIDLSARRLCGKIEQEIRRLAEGAPVTAERLMREALYQVASSPSVSERIKEIGRVYEWPGQFTIEEKAQQVTLPAVHEALAEVNRNESIISAGNQVNNNLPEITNPDEIEYKLHEKVSRQRMALEILANLEKIERIIDRFFLDSATRPDLQKLPSLFKQVSAALIMLELERAHTLLDLCHDLVNKLSSPLDKIEPSEQTLIATGLSSLGFFIEALKDAQSDNGNIIETALALFDNEIAIEVSAPIPLSTVTHEDVLPDKIIEAVATEIDPELLAIFLEEADEVLLEMAESLQLCQQDLAHIESLTTLRRGFHTLKGSGRMVKLQALSEVARSMEQVMDHWLNVRKSITQELIDLTTQAHLAFCGWCDNLQQRGTTEVNAEELLFLANALIDNVPENIPVAATEVAIKERQTAESFSPALPFNPLLIPQPIPPKPIQLYDAYDDINPALWQVFFEEAQALTLEIASKLRAWCILPQDSNIPKALLRSLHTLKGSSRMAGAMHLGERMHDMESDIERIICEKVIPVPMIKRLAIDFEEINERIDCLQDPHLLDARITETEKIEITPDSETSFLLQPAETARHPNVSAEEEIELPSRKSVVHVDAELIDRLVNESGEMSIVRSRVEAQLHNFKQSLLDLNESVDRLRDQLREVEIQAETQMQPHLAQTQKNDPSFDPLELDRFTRFQELTRLMAESVDDIVTVQQSLRITHSVTEEAVTQQARMNHQLQHELMRLCALPFSHNAEHYYRIISQAAQDLNKKVDLHIQGDEIEIDRSVLEKINSSLEHLLRNAVAHGIEESEQRLLLNKSETGRVTLSLRQEGNEIAITVNDDGSGLDLSRIHKEAVDLGLIQNDEALDNNQVMSLIFEQGLTTCNEVTDIAGRGIGMDVVKNAVSALGGRIEIDSEIDKGTTFHIYLPLNLAVAQTLLIRAADKTYAVPAVIVEHIHEINADALKAAYQQHHVEFNKKNYPFAHLAQLFGELHQLPRIQRHNRLLLLHSGALRLAVHVDELLGNSEVVVKNIGVQLAHAPGVEGATIRGDDEVILIINPVKLLQREEVQKIFTSPCVPIITAQQKPRTTPVIMVVDDSVTVRKTTGRLLEREGYEVLMAKNGLAAIELLQKTIPDVVLVDLEMPQMDGFELIRNLRNNPDTGQLPIIIISSRTADKHRKMAEDLGVNIFLGKPYHEAELLDHITRYTHP